jgi:hypothetical protein
MTRPMKLAGALAALLIVFGMVFGAGQAAADSLPGEALYGVKLAIEEIRQTLTTNPEARAALDRGLVERRLGEVQELLEQGRDIDGPVVDRVAQQAQAALDSALALGGELEDQALQQLDEALQLRLKQVTATQARLPQPKEEPVRQIVRVMERIRTEAHAGQGEPDGEQERQRLGTPPEPTKEPNPERTPGPHQTPRQGEGDLPDEPAQGPGANESPNPQGPNADEPAGPDPQGPNADEPSGPNPQGPNTDEPAGPNPQGPNSDEPSGPNPQGPNSDETFGPKPQGTPEPGKPSSIVLPASEPRSSLGGTLQGMQDMNDMGTDCMNGQCHSDKDHGCQGHQNCH